MPTATRERDPTKDSDWVDLAAHWRPRPDTIYLNHGSFGLPPDEVRYARRGFINRLDENPMDFFVRQMEGLLLAAKATLSEFVGTRPDNLIFVDNATYGMNVVANSFALSPGDEILIGDHEYGAVHRIWESKCKRYGANHRVAALPPAVRIRTGNRRYFALCRHGKHETVGHQPCYVGHRFDLAGQENLRRIFQARYCRLCRRSPCACSNRIEC